MIKIKQIIKCRKGRCEDITKTPGYRLKNSFNKESINEEIELDLIVDQLNNDEK